MAYRFAVLFLSVLSAGLAGCVTTSEAKREHRVRFDDKYDKFERSRMISANSTLMETSAGGDTNAWPPGSTLSATAYVSQTGVNYALFFRDNSYLSASSDAAARVQAGKLEAMLEPACKAVPVLVDGQRHDLPVGLLSVEPQKDRLLDNFPQIETRHIRTVTISVSVEPALMGTIASAKSVEYRMCGVRDGAARDSELKALKEVYRRAASQA